MARVKVTPEMMAKAMQDTDWEKIDATTDEDIAQQAAADPDVAPVLTDAETVAALARTVRKRLGLSQPAFAARYGIPVGTLRDWEQARRQPGAAALPYLRVIAQEPEMVERVLHPAA
jgi:putative transcriptional regulator